MIDAFFQGLPKYIWSIQTLNPSSQRAESNKRGFANVIIGYGATAAIEGREGGLYRPPHQINQRGLPATIANLPPKHITHPPNHSSTYILWFTSFTSTTNQFSAKMVSMEIIQNGLVSAVIMVMVMVIMVMVKKAGCLIGEFERSWFSDDKTGVSDNDRWLNFVCAEHLNLIGAADDGSFTRVTVTCVLLPFEEGVDGDWRRWRRWRGWRGRRWWWGCQAGSWSCPPCVKDRQPRCSQGSCQQLISVSAPASALHTSAYQIIWEF